MFTGIIEEVGIINTVRAGSLTISAAKVLQETVVGGSIAVNGVCLTVTSVIPGKFSVSVMPETLRRSNLSQLRTGNHVNLERALKLGGRIGGHLVQGHIDATGKIISLIPEENAILLRCSAPPEIMRYIVNKGFITVDGVSLTVFEHDAHSFAVSLVEYTRKNTILGELLPSSIINLEVDIIAKYVEALGQGSHSGITLENLAEKGYLSP